ncbi:ATP-binding cassette domain-containing protein [Actinomadura sp. J1-007]|uniref:ATP-binding cassette domain-containing protein n=1 Tax=Actinomadura sp. J1-007 TaxID=2661913 RepID=UPI001F4F5C6C|nr:ATP-binding cassette domain-containing protein [Actinomadura sp. J1-007]
MRPLLSRVRPRAAPPLSRTAAGPGRALAGAAGVVAAAGALAAALPAGQVRVVALGLVFGIVALSTVLLTGCGGQISLAQLGVAGVGAVAAARMGGGSPAALVAASGAAAVAGALAAPAAPRLNGLRLAFATLAFGALMEAAVFRTGLAFGRDGALEAHGLSVAGLRLGSERGYLVLSAVVFAVVGTALAALRRGPYGRLVLALRDSPAACAALGLNVRLARVALFAVAAGIAGLAGALLGGLRGNVSASGFSALGGLALLLLAVACGATSVTGAAIGGAALAWLRRRRAVRVGDPSGGEGLVAAGVTVRFGGVAAVDGAGLVAHPATVTGLVGASGAGKTTFLDALSGPRRPAGGSVRLGGADLSGRAPHERARHGMARTFQRTEAFGSLTVRENVQVAAEIHAMTREAAGRSARDRRRRRRAARGAAGAAADALLARVGIAEYAARPARTVPAGAARLLDLARALATEPRALLLDEPSAGLSAPESRSLECLLRDLASEGVAVLLAEPDLDAVLGVCDVLYVLDAGRVVASGPPAQVRADLRARDACLARPA